MKLLVVVLCLLSERFLNHSSPHQRFFWFTDYWQFIKKRIDSSSFFSNPWMILVAIIAPIIFVVSILYLLFHGIFFGFAGLIMSIVLFYYCLGPQNAFYPLSKKDSSLPHRDWVGSYFIMMNSQVFALIFWYMIAGPIAALIYRLMSLCRTIDCVSKPSTQCTDILEWIPARITALLYLLVGNFQRGIATYRQYFFANPNLNEKMLSDCGLQAVQSNESDEIPMLDAEGLVEHATIVLLVFVALLTLISA